MSQSEKERLSFQVYKTNKMMRQLIDRYSMEKGVEDIALVHGWILGYLADHENEDVYQKTIEKRFSIAKSHVTGILKTLESQGYITRCSVKNDARLKKIRLTEKGRESDLAVRQSIDEMESVLSEALNDEEKSQLISLLQKLQFNVAERR
ncbi:MAG: MarR family transcriptional regulator [Erysipelotrichaceae bacterium]|nr:MarR family transcriptional regulator [Erysipelotrichaceae bacterium]